MPLSGSRRTLHQRLRGSLTNRGSREHRRLDGDEQRRGGARDAARSAADDDRARRSSGEDVGARGNVFLITKGFLEEFGPQRIIDTPLAEASIVGIAVGMAMEGLRPIAEIQFADFIYPAFNQIVGEAAKTRYRSNGDYTCPLVIRTPYGGGVRGALSHSVSIEALFYHVPGLKIVAPSTPRRHQGPAHRGDRGSRSGALPRAQEDVPARSRARCPRGTTRSRSARPTSRRQATQLTVVSYGSTCIRRSMRRAQLESDGISVEVIDLRSIRPMDKTTILESVREDAQAPDRSRRQQVRRHRRGDQRDGRRGGALRSRRADPAPVRPRRARRWATRCRSRKSS